jgi:hypothetical protein
MSFNKIGKNKEERKIDELTAERKRKQVELFRLEAELLNQNAIENMCVKVVKRKKDEHEAATRRIQQIDRHIVRLTERMS